MPFAAASCLPSAATLDRQSTTVPKVSKTRTWMAPGDSGGRLGAADDTACANASEAEPRTMAVRRKSRRSMFSSLREVEAAVPVRVM
jgi:hypothetical protein